MPSSDTSFYTDFFEWEAETARKLVDRIVQGKSSFAQLRRFISDCASITKALVAVWEDVPRGEKFYRLLPKLAAWIVATPDPMLTIRVRMRTIQKTWDEELK